MAEYQSIDQIPCLPDRPDDGHKGTFGTVIVIGGCPTMIGAPAFCATAAFRSGAGLVKIACDASILPHVLSIEPSATGIAIQDEATELQNRLEIADPNHTAVLAVGPGIGKSRYAADRVASALSGSRTVVLDADGLNLLAESDLGTGREDGPGLVMTPHLGEFRRLAEKLGMTADPVDPSERSHAAAQLADAYAAVVVLKGHRSIVTDGRRVYTNLTGNPALSTAGSGDVLTGLIAGFIAQGMALFEASALGVYLHGLTGDLWAQQFGPTGMTTRDLLMRLPSALRSHGEAGDTGTKQTSS